MTQELPIFTLQTTFPHHYSPRGNEEMATDESKDVEMKDVEAEEKEENPKQAQIDKDLLTFEGLSI